MIRCFTDCSSLLCRRPTPPPPSPTPTRVDAADALSTLPSVRRAVTKCFADCSSFHCCRLTQPLPPPTPTQVVAADALSTLSLVRRAVSSCFADCSSLHCRRLTQPPPPPTPTHARWPLIYCRSTDTDTRVAAADPLSTLSLVNRAVTSCFADCSSLHCRRLKQPPPPPTPAHAWRQLFCCRHCHQ